MDPLSSMLRAVRLTGAVFFEIDAANPWAAETPPGETIVDAVMPGSGHLIPYHVLTPSGYESEVPLAEPKKIVGVPPARWRKEGSTARPN
ncbi:MAG TPA: cupin domain-containing protein [Candidatus Baltobacteraceae bacterium]|nr:cupin domain-containing protein [Candidatus Baltobacteraceae bacterium]